MVREEVSTPRLKIVHTRKLSCEHKIITYCEPENKNITFQEFRGFVGGKKNSITKEMIDVVQGANYRAVRYFCKDFEKWCLKLGWKLEQRQSFC